jgi:hypothetical protein
MSAATSVPIGGATLEILSTPLAVTTDVLGNYGHAFLPAGAHDVRLEAFGYHPIETTISVAAGSDVVVNFSMNAAFVAEDFETAPARWIVAGGADRGMWERGDPAGTARGGIPVQPEDDHTPDPGVNAWITGLARGSTVNSWDVDAGATTLTTPSYNVTAMADPHLSYRRWYSTGVGEPVPDTWVVEVSPNGGGTWVLVEALARAQAAWVEVDVPIYSLINPSALTKFRFTAQDSGSRSTTEAGLDDFMIYDVEIIPSPQTDAPLLPSSASVVELGQSRPNPFRAGSATRVSLMTTMRGRVGAHVYDVAGRRVVTLLEGVLDAGVHPLQWDGRGAAGRLAPAGVYFLRVTTPTGRGSRKLLVVR